MRRRLVLLLTAVALGWIYMLAFTLAVGLAAALATPRWWLHLFSTPEISALLWMAIAHAVSIVLVSLPFAWIISRVYGRFGIPLALAITAIICAFIEIPVMFQDFRMVGLLLQSMWLLGAAVLLIALPLTVWVFGTWPSNNRWRGP